MKTSWVVVASLAALILLQPGLLLFAAHYHITSSFQTEAELASVMGAIFTAGGLIVALLSLYTLANVDKVMRDGVRTALETIPQRLDERIRIFLDAYTSFREAQDLWSRYHFSALNEIEGLILRAEHIEPTLRDLRRWSGTVFFEAARGSFLREHAPDGTYRECPPSLNRPALAVKALQRLKPEFDATSDDGQAIALQIAELHAILGDSPKTVAHWIERARASAPLPLLNGVNSLTLAAGCRTERDIQIVLNAHGLRIMTADEIRAALQSVPDKAVQSFAVVVGRTEGLQNPPVNPTVVTFRSVDKWSNAFLGWYARPELNRSSLLGGIPAYGELVIATGYQDSPPFMDLDTLLGQACDRFYFVAPYNFETFYTY